MLKFNKILIVFTLIIIILTSFIAVASAGNLDFKNAPDLYEKTATAGGLTRGDLPNIAAAIIQAILGLVGAAFFILFIYGGVKWMTASSNDEKINKAKKLIVAAVIGLAIVIAAYAITFFISEAIESGPSVSNGSPPGGVAP